MSGGRRSKLNASFNISLSWLISRLNVMVELGTCSVENQVGSLIKTQNCITYIFNSNLKLYIFFLPFAYLLMY